MNAKELIPIYIWADGTYCLKEDLEEFIAFISDDYVTRKTCACCQCGQLYIPEYDEPFASCECGTSEWYC
jgi:hypothetical protein